MAQAMIVLDASALIAMVRGEAGWDRVAAALPRSAISTVNLTEIFTRLVDLGLNQQELERYQIVLGSFVVPFDEDLALRAAALRRQTKAHGLSLGDRACLALAQRLGVPAMTADVAWSRVDPSIEIQVIR